MGEINQNVNDIQLKNNTRDREILTPFLHGFDISWGAERNAFNTNLSMYILKPEQHIIESFGITNEVLLVYSRYPTIERRAIQSAEAFFNEYPAKGRVDTLAYFLVSEAKNIKEWVRDFISDNQESRIIIALSGDELRSHKADGYFVRSAINEQLFSRDLFDFRLPLVNDTYFFGRMTIIGEYIDAIRRGENKGLFGLRKTGKTSVLYKLKRVVERENIADLFYYDCKLPAIRKLRWYELLELIINDVSRHFSIGLKTINDANITDTLTSLLNALPQDQRIVLAFDEIEWISFIAQLDAHWETDFIDFWQTLWSCQSIHRRLSFIIAGVSPVVVEKDTIKNVQNPLFGLVSYDFLRGFELEELKAMGRKLGKRMGMDISHDAIDYLMDRYGGHPLLTRLALSSENRAAKQKPITITKDTLALRESIRDSELVFYCRHVVSEIKRFYPDDYEMLEVISCGHIKDFIELSRGIDCTHLESYGLVSYVEKIPQVSISVIGKYVALELASRDGRKTILKVIESSERPDWLKRKVDSIIQDLRLLERLIGTNSLPSLFGPNSFPEADRFANISVCATEPDFIAFINTCNRCFLDAIENFGKSIGKSQYFWSEIQYSYSGLFHGLLRIKLYRHQSFHSVLNTRASQQLQDFLDKDLERRHPSEVQDLFFVLQQCILDGLLNSIQIEINRLT